MYVILLRWSRAAVALGVIVVTSGILKKSWYDLLGQEPVSGSESEAVTD